MPTNIEAPERIWLGLCPLHGPVQTEHRCRDYDGRESVEYIRAPITTEAGLAQARQIIARSMNDPKGTYAERLEINIAEALATAPVPLADDGQVALTIIDLLNKRLCERHNSPLAEDRVEAEKAVSLEIARCGVAIVNNVAMLLARVRAEQRTQ